VVGPPERQSHSGFDAAPPSRRLRLGGDGRNLQDRGPRRARRGRQEHDRLRVR
jgi:hypothetical protein